MNADYDLIVIGGGSGGLTAARFGAQLGARVALIEKNQIGGDCTWTGCVPSKALLKAAKVAHTVRQAEPFGVSSGQCSIDMGKVRAYVRHAIADVYQLETPEALALENVEVIHGVARFVDAKTIAVDDRSFTFRRLIICTGAWLLIPPIAGLDAVPYFTYEQLFDNDTLPERLVILGAGPIGAEIAQAYQRLGSQVTLVDVALLPREEPEAADTMLRLFQREGIRFVPGLATAVGHEQDETWVEVDGQVVRGNMLLVAVGRRPNMDQLGLESAGIAYADSGIVVDRHLRTSVNHIYAAGDCTGGHQFTHYAGWQGFQAARNALLPGSSDGVADTVPWTTFTDPEVAHVGLTEAEARSQHGADAHVARWDNERTDRAICDGETAGFVKVVYRKDGTILGATVVSSRAGEVINEFALALKHDLKLRDVAEAMHVYPTYSMPVMQMSANIATHQFIESWLGRLAKKLSGIN